MDQWSDIMAMVSPFPHICRLLYALFVASINWLYHGNNAGPLVHCLVKDYNWRMLKHSQLGIFFKRPGVYFKFYDFMHFEKDRLFIHTNICHHYKNSTQFSYLCVNRMSTSVHNLALYLLHLAPRNHCLPVYRPVILYPLFMALFLHQ